MNQHRTDRANRDATGVAALNRTVERRRLTVGIVTTAAVGLAAVLPIVPADAAAKSRRSASSTTARTATATTATSTATTALPPTTPATAPSAIPVTTATPRSVGPIRIMVPYFELTTVDTRYILAAAQARAAAQNAAGGIKGRQVEIVPCDMKFDLAASEACARLAVTSKVDAFGPGVSLVAPPPSSGSPVGVADTATVIPILAAGGIPWLGALMGAGNQEATNPAAFPIGATVVGNAGEAVAMVNQGCRRIAFLGSPLGRDPFRRGLASKGQEPVFEGLFPQGDPAPAIGALAARNVDCVYLGALESGIRTFVDTADRAGVQLRYGWFNDFVSERGLAQLGPLLDGSIVSGYTRSSLDLSDPAVRQYRSELDRYYPGRRYDSGGFGAWGGIDLLLQAMQGIEGDVNANSVMKALRSFKGNTALFGPVDFTRELANPDYRRMSVANAFSYRIFNAKPIRIGEPFDVSAVFEKVS